MNELKALGNGQNPERFAGGGVRGNGRGAKRRSVVWTGQQNAENEVFGIRAAEVIETR